MGSLREEDQEQNQQPRSRSRADSLQKTSFFSVAVCFKSTALLVLYSPEQHRRRCHTHDRTAPAGSFRVCCQSPKSKSGLDSDEGAWPPSVHPETPPVASGELIEVVWCAGTASPSQCSKWPNNDRREALGHSIAHHRSYGATALQDASHFGQWLSPCSRSVDLMACRRPTA